MINSGRVLAVSSLSDSCLLMCTETESSRPLSRKIGHLSWSFLGLGMGVIEKRLANVGSIRWMRM